MRRGTDLVEDLQRENDDVVRPIVPDRDRLDQLYEALSASGRKALLVAAVALAKEEGLSEGDEPVRPRRRYPSA
jgi:hypothetical protein